MANAFAVELDLCDRCLNLTKLRLEIAERGILDGMGGEGQMGRLAAIQAALQHVTCALNLVAIAQAPLGGES